MLYPGRGANYVIKKLGNVHAMLFTMDEHAMNVNPGTEKYRTVVAALMKNLEKTTDAKVNEKTVFTILLLICCVVALLYHK